MVALVVVHAFVDRAEISVITFFIVDATSVYWLIDAVAIDAESGLACFGVAVIRFLAAVRLLDMGAGTGLCPRRDIADILSTDFTIIAHLI